MFPRLLFFLFWAIWATSTDSITLPTTIEIDLVFPLNQTYTLIEPFPVIFVIQNAAVAWDWGFIFEWNITGESDGEFFSGFSGVLVAYPGHPAPSDPFIVVNSTVPSPPSPDLFIIVNPERPAPPAVANNTLPAGKYTLGWSYESSTCTPYGYFFEIGSGISTQGSISFTVEGGRASPDFTSSCPILAGQIDIVANSTGCPQVGTPGTGNPCGAKIDAAQASSISAVLALSTSSTTSANIAGREQLGSGLLGAAAGIAGLGILLL